MPRNKRVKKEEKGYNFRMPPDMYDLVAKNAKENERSINSELLIIMKQYIDGYEVKRGITIVESGLNIAKQQPTISTEE